MVTASKGMADVYRLTNRTDSAFRYYSLYHQHQDTLTAQINRGKLSAINAKIAFDDAQSNLEKANNVISNQKQTRNFILAGIVLLTIIALLFYNRKMLQQKHLAEETARKQRLVEQEAERAKTQISSFRANIIEKDNLIQRLQQQINVENEQVNKSLLNYTLITDTEWEKFRLEFFMAYPLFLPALQEKIPAINPAEERLATLLYLKLSTNQIANTLGISKDSVGRSKRRLKQRLNLSTEDLLEEYLSKLV
ncbi:helix-turn-helix transcriptional regulator [Pedobacter sp. UC225_65]|uniref:helix-turn-helix transcriptional regulator n=1 Tax=Pedobacter sp. UC225_65 TaxID=3350173 RepID=UPI00366B81DC